MGVVHDRPRARATGALAVLAATLAAPNTGLADLAVLAEVVATVVAYDGGERTVGVYAHAPDAATGRFEGRRTAWALAVCTAAVALARVPTTATPAGAALALAGGVLVALSLRDDRTHR